MEIPEPCPLCKRATLTARVEALEQENTDFKSIEKGHIYLITDLRSQLKLKRPVAMQELVELAEANGWSIQDGPMLTWLKSKLDRVADLESNLLDFVDAGAGPHIDTAWHRRAFDRARQNLNR